MGNKFLWQLIQWSSFRLEKEELVKKLYEEGKTIREIAKQVHMSIGPIGNIYEK